MLHPSRKSDYLKHNWERKWIKPATQAVKNLWVDFKQHHDIFLPEALTPKQDQITDQANDYNISRGWI